MTTIFIKSLIQTADDFLINIFQGAVITVPATFTDAQGAALENAATHAAVNVIQLQEQQRQLPRTFGALLVTSKPIVVDLRVDPSFYPSLYSLYVRS